jgi:hypothetical protein
MVTVINIKGGTQALMLHNQMSMLGGVDPWVHTLDHPVDIHPDGKITSGIMSSRLMLLVLL